MDGNQKLCFSYNKEKLYELLLDENFFEQFCLYLLENRCLNINRKAEFIYQNKYINKEETVKNLLNFLINQSLFYTINALDQIDEIAARNLSNELRNNEIWKKFINDVKIERRKDSSSIKPLPFCSTQPIRLSDIITPIEVSEVVNCNLFDTTLTTTNVNYENFHETIMEKSFNKILVQGEPGTGKSVQVKHLTYLWAYDKWVSCKDKLIIFIILKDVEEDDDLYDTIINQNFQDINYINRNILKCLFIEKNNEILLLLDGADEFDINSHSLNNIIEKRNSPVPTIIWSRKWKAKLIHNSCDLRFELTGLNDKQLNIFYKKCFKDDVGDKSNDFLKILKKQNESVQNLCKIPLLAIIMFYVWKKNGNFLTKKLYDIYDDLLSTIHEKNIIQDNSYKKEKTMKLIQKICFNNLLRNEKTFLLKESYEVQYFEKYLNGLIQIIPKIYSSSNNVEIQFYHLSIQEFLAAKYLIESAKHSKFKTKNIKKLLDEQQLDKNRINIFNIMEFIRNHSEEIFKKIVLNSKKIQNMYECSDNVKNLLENGLINELPLELNNEILNNDVLSILFERIGKNIQKIILNNTKINVNLLINELSLNSPQLKELSINNNDTDDMTIKMTCFYKNGLFFNNLLNLIATTNLIKLNSGNLNIKIIRETNHSLQKIRQNVSSLKISNDDHENIIFQVSLGIMKLKILEDETQFFSTEINDDTLNFIDKLLYLESLIFKNKCLKEETSVKLFNLIIKKRKMEFLRRVCLINIFIELPDEKFIHNCYNLIKPLKDYHNPSDYICKFNKRKSKNSIDIDLYKNNNLLFILNMDEDYNLNNFNVHKKLWTFNKIQSIESVINGWKENKILFRQFNHQIFMKFKYLMNNFSYNNLLSHNNDLFNELRILNFNESSLSHELSKYYLENIPKFSKLKYINLSSICLSESLSEVFNNIIKNSKYLTSLIINKCNLDEYSISKLADSIGYSIYLELLSIIGNYEIKLGFNRLCVNLFQQSSKYLNYVDFSDCNINRDMATSFGVNLKNSPNIQSILLDKNKEMGSGFYVICDGIETLKHFKLLSIRYCNIHKNQAIYLGGILKLHSTIESLYIDGNQSMDEGFFTICYGLKISGKNFKEFSLNSCNLTEDYAINLGDFLKSCSSLKSISLRDNQNMENAFSDVCDGLRNSSKTIKCIDLAWCKLNEGQTIYLSNLLKECINIETLLLEKNPKTDGMINIFSSLKSSSDTLKELNLNYCSLTNIEAKSLGENLLAFHKLEFLSLRENNQMENGFRYICDGLKSSKNGFKKFDLIQCNLNENQSRCLAELLSNCVNFELLLFYNENHSTLALNTLFDRLSSEFRSKIVYKGKHIS